MNVTDPTWQQLVGAFAFFSALSMERYLVFVGLGFAALWAIARWPAWRAPIEPGAPDARQLRREILLSAGTVLIGGAIAPAILLAGAGPKMAFYPHVSDRGLAYFVFSIVLMLFVRDTLFYWAHRALHHRALFRFAHRTHHLSTRPNPWTSYSVHPLENLFDVVVTFVVILFLVPKHVLAYQIFLWLDAAMAVLGHVGFEPWPRGFSRHWLGRWINTATAHHWHHASARHNYGFHFLVWDRWMGTLDPQYDERFERASRVPPGQPATP